MAKYSAGLIPFRIGQTGALEILIVHPGGPFWSKKDDGAWSIAKGEYEPDEDPLVVAEREFVEELGTLPPTGERLELGEISQSGGKRVVAWAVSGDVDIDAGVTSNSFEMEWPPKSGKLQT